MITVATAAAAALHPGGLAAHAGNPLSLVTHLCQVGDLHVALCLDDLSCVRAEPAHDDLQLRRLACAVDACSHAEVGAPTAQHRNSV